MKSSILRGLQKGCSWQIGVGLVAMATQQQEGSINPATAAIKRHQLSHTLKITFEHHLFPAHARNFTTMTARMFIAYVLQKQ
jgi:hypothetical protein